MSKFNKSTTVREQLEARPDATRNHENGLAFKPTPELELYLRACEECGYNSMVVPNLLDEQKALWDMIEDLKEDFQF